MGKPTTTQFSNEVGLRNRVLQKTSQADGVYYHCCSNYEEFTLRLKTGCTIRVIYYEQFLKIILL